MIDYTKESKEGEIRESMLPRSASFSVRSSGVSVCFAKCPDIFRMFYKKVPKFHAAGELTRSESGNFEKNVRKRSFFSGGRADLFHLCCQHTPLLCNPFFFVLTHFISFLACRSSPISNFQDPMIQLGQIRYVNILSDIFLPDRNMTHHPRAELARKIC
jgi:hypothetical protein